ncbi:replication factor C subunit 3/5 [Gigaspora margarita]|uniref:Replication factor C subunit 3/5 n=1 Tax=Gigaspora margarita TaxID=4874 RepID=A0A8H3X2H9_GIGMA|nr:replication factor C subunit 3/5 [Gigaspora margarita]
MSLWIDKYRPTTLENLTFNQGLSRKLKNLTDSDFPHLLIFGPSGAGKKTRILCILKELFGDGAEKIKIDQRSFDTQKKKLEINIISSKYHIELTPSDVGNYDKIVFQELLTEIAQTQQIDADAKQRFKVVVINEADEITRDAQAALRRTMEKYMSNLRIILCCNSTSRIIEPIRSRCMLIRVPLPSIDEISTTLQHIASNEDIRLSKSLADKISLQSQRNPRKAILTFEVMASQKKKLNDNAEIPKVDWEQVIDDIVGKIVKTQTAETLSTIRQKIYELQSHCIPPSLILKKIALGLFTNEDIHSKARLDIINSATHYDHRLRTGRHSIFHLEAFVSYVMTSIYSVRF